MEIKTYSRARAARAALIKILDAHEEVGTVNTIEVEAGRFTADVHFATAPTQWLQEDLAAAGFAMYWPIAEEELPDAIGVEPKAPRNSAYVAETSTVAGATKRVWTIAESMPGAARKEVIAACREAGIAFGTARTQYQKWYKANKAG